MYTELGYCPDGGSIALGCRSGEVYLLDVEANKKTKLSQTAKHGNRVQIVKWTDDYLLTIGWDNVLRKWDPR